jgi:hypothetical protein
MSTLAPIGADFWPRYETLARNVGLADSFDLLRVWMNESGVSSTAENPHGHASGIFQAMPDTMAGLGFMASAKIDGATRAQAFRSLTATQQLDWAERYYRPAAGRLSTAAACYLWTFVPADIGLASNPDAVISAKVGSTLCPAGRRSSIFDVNAGFDENGDSAIQVHELTDAIDRACRGPRWAMVDDGFRAYLGLEPLPPPAVPGAPDFRAVDGIQSALAALGFDPGEIDNVIGPRTRAAITAFQSAHGLVVDGIPGPLTRGALEEAYAALSA